MERSERFSSGGRTWSARSVGQRLTHSLTGAPTKDKETGTQQKYSNKQSEIHMTKENLFQLSDIKETKTIQID